MFDRLLRFVGRSLPSRSANVSPEVRRLLDHPATRYRIVDAWLLRQRYEALKYKQGKWDVW